MEREISLEEIKNMRSEKIGRKKVYVVGAEFISNKLNGRKLVCDCGCETFWHKEALQQFPIQCTDCGAIDFISSEHWDVVLCKK